MDTWTLSNPTMIGSAEFIDNWTSVTYGNGLFVAVASTRTGTRVMTSPDDITWTSRTFAADIFCRSVTYGNGIFVAVAVSDSDNRVMTSPDDITWTSRTSAADNGWTSVTYGNGLFVAVAFSETGNGVMTSPDGITWTSRTSAADNFWYSVTYGNGLFVAVASSGSGNRVMTSPDGINWSSRTSAADNFWRSVTYGNGLFVAVADTGTGNRVMTSPDDITWTSRTSAADNNWISVTYGNGLFVAVAFSGSGNRVMTSPDDINWTSRTSAADNNWRSVTYGNGLFVAVAFLGTANGPVFGRTIPMYMYVNVTVVCFGEDTEILTNNGYVKIKDLRKGDLVETTYNDYVPINMIGVSQIYNSGDYERIKDRLYKYTSNEYPQITKDLILTGCHSILVDEITDQEKEGIINVLNDLYVTDHKYRLPACVDAKSKPYEKKGRFDIYHIALENACYYGNYGIYANGLLVESCSKRYLKELSNMKLL